MNIVLANTLVVFFRVVYVVLLIRIILSWLTMGRENRLMELLYAITEPILAPIRKLVNRSPLGGPGMVLDFSPMIAILLLFVAEGILVSLVEGMTF